MTNLRYQVEATVELLGYLDNSDLVILACFSCGSPAVMTTDHYRRAREDRSINFYCSRGHGQIFTKTKVEELQERLQRAEELANGEVERRRRAEAATALVREEKDALERRVSRGVCPVCRRTFTNAQRHIEKRHPEIVEKHRPVIPSKQPVLA